MLISNQSIPAHTWKRFTSFNHIPLHINLLLLLLDTHIFVFVILQENAKGSGHGDSLKQLLHNLDLSYRLEWVSERKVLLSRHGHELGTFQL